MEATRISIDEFIKLAEQHLVLDVRSPLEYTHSHYPEAVSIPIFNNDERKEIGTTYKQKSRALAIKIGLDFFGEKMRAIIEQVEDILKNKASQKVIVYCWRGGMRSKAFSWLLNFYGFEVFILEGGYKAYRNWVLEKLATPQKLCILSGKTGSGKTEILNQFKQENLPVIDLEGLAHHKGSAFGGIGMEAQEGNEQFENLLALELHKIETQFGSETPIWLESESSRIGHVNINYLFFNQMKIAPRVYISIPFEERLEFILKGYGSLEKEELIHSTERIKNRLGGLETKMAIQFLEEDNIKAAFAILLKYYDKSYAKGDTYQKEFLSIALENIDYKKNASIILKETEKYHAGRTH
ncbi:MAG TPA: tRNA 2-selenouridine(34) synthase MnmH [Edaphocola sp.]|nr:tRNA 2-selenouridine(34) synthase MnmH [Edaphocola sp.]